MRTPLWCHLVVLLLSSYTIAEEKSLDKKTAIDKSDIHDLTKKGQYAPLLIEICQKKISGMSVSATDFLDCLEEQEKIEQVNVYGKFIGIEPPGSSGHFRLNKDFINAAPKSNGNINELLSLLPGVAISENAFGVDSAAEIKAQELSISGGQPWQTGFFMDGMNYNNRNDPAATEVSLNNANEVQSSSQVMTLNNKLVSSVSVYDNNIPVEYGGFSGGVVDVSTIDAFDSISNTSLDLVYRHTQSNWGKYHYILAEDSDLAASDLDNLIPQYRKNNYGFTLNHRFNQKQGILLSVNATSSDIDDLSLGKPHTQSRENLNTLLKYSYRDGIFETLDASIFYSPYRSNNFIKNVLDSDFVIDGGAYGGNINTKYNFSIGELESKLSYTQSNNSRQAPDHYYIWLLAKGKEWGNNRSNTGVVNTDQYTSIDTSLEGGHGDLENHQQRFSLNNKFSLNSFSTANISHSLYLGLNIEYENQIRDRKQNSYYYNSARQYSTALDSDGLNCSGYSLDCVELAYHIPLPELAENFGGQLDLTDPEQLQAYSNNVAVTPQYFESRLVRPKEKITANIARFGAYVSDTISIERLELNLGLRADYDDFFENINIAPRSTLSVDVFNNGKSYSVFGFNRYYDAGMLTYRIREQRKPNYTQYRPIRNNYLQGWLDSTAVSDYNYIYDDVKTPYDDEFVAAWKQTTDYFGNFSLKYIHRDKINQLSREPDTITGTDKKSYIKVNNAGSGESERYSFSWNFQLRGHSLWLNVSKEQSYTNVESYDASPDQIPLDELVSYDGELISKNKLTFINTNFSRPISGSLGWTKKWADLITTSLTASHSGSYETAIFTGNYVETNQIKQTCPECESTQITVPDYQKSVIKSRTLANLSIHWRVPSPKKHRLVMDLDISNLFNSRTHTVRENNDGIETGRQFWLGLTYSYD